MSDETWDWRGEVDYLRRQLGAALVAGDEARSRLADTKAALRTAREALECIGRVVGSEFCGACSLLVELCDSEHGVNCVGCVARRALSSPPAMGAPDAPTACVCPFPRVTCPNCDNPCRACRYVRSSALGQGQGKAQKSEPASTSMKPGQRCTRWKLPRHEAAGHAFSAIDDDSWEHGGFGDKGGRCEYVHHEPTPEPTKCETCLDPLPPREPYNYVAVKETDGGVVTKPCPTCRPTKGGTP